MRFVAAAFRTLIGAIFGIFAALALSPAMAAFSPSPDGGSAYVLGVLIVGAALGLFAPNIRRAFGRGFLLLGVSFIALPISTMMLSGRVASDMVSNADAQSQGMTALGAGVAGIALTGAATFIGLIAGTILIIIGLVLALGGRREVIVIDRHPA